MAIVGSSEVLVNELKYGIKDKSGVKPYLMHHKILLVGEGDFSFSLCLARHFGSGSNICATSFDSYDVLARKYKKAKSNVENLVRLGASVLYGLDATKMENCLELQSESFDRIIFNFPHAGFHGKENNGLLIEMHKNLVRKFFSNASHMLRQNGEIHVSHKTKAPFCDWNLKELASESSLVLIGCVDFKKEDFPGYENKRGDGLNCDEPFHLGKCSTFMFGFPPRTRATLGLVPDFEAQTRRQVLSGLGSSQRQHPTYVQKFPVQMQEQPVSFYLDFQQRQNQTLIRGFPDQVHGYPASSNPGYRKTDHANLSDIVPHRNLLREPLLNRDYPKRLLVEVHRSYLVPERPQHQEPYFYLGNSQRNLHTADMNQKIMHNQLPSPCGIFPDCSRVPTRPHCHTNYTIMPQPPRPYCERLNMEKPRTAINTSVGSNPMGKRLAFFPDSVGLAKAVTADIHFRQEYELNMNRSKRPRLVYI